jgi:hypothetical protein
MNSKLIKQMNKITYDLIGISLANDTNSASFNSRTKELAWTGNDSIDISFVLKSESYEDIYRECLKRRAYNICFIDGALIQIMYRLDKRNKNIIAHRLAYLPNPNIELFSNNDNFEEDYYDSLDLFSEFIDKSSQPIPVRFDYDNSQELYKECIHTYSHLTLGNYKDCRIPVSTPISPYKFIDFILRNFYARKYIDFFKQCDLRFDNLLSENEKKIFHINC